MMATGFCACGFFVFTGVQHQRKKDNFLEPTD